MFRCVPARKILFSDKYNNEFSELTLKIPASKMECVVKIRSLNQEIQDCLLKSICAVYLRTL